MQCRAEGGWVRHRADKHKDYGHCAVKTFVIAVGRPFLNILMQN